jgi:hypothetical protein
MRGWGIYSYRFIQWSSEFLVQSTAGVSSVGLHDGSSEFAVQSTPVNDGGDSFGPLVNGAQLPLTSTTVSSSHVGVDGSGGATPKSSGKRGPVVRWVCIITYQNHKCVLLQDPE